MLDFENPAHIRLKQIEWMDLDEAAVSRWCRPLGGNWYWSAAYGFIDGAKDAIRMLKRRTSPHDALCANVKLPMESGAPDFSWGDAVSQNVAFKDGENRVMMSFNQWNRGDKPHDDHVSYVYVRRPAAVQYLRVRHDEMTATKAGAPIRGACHSLVLGPWLVVQNSDPGKGVDFRLPDGFARSAVDLATKKPVKSAVLSLAPGETRVLKRHGGL